VNRLLSLSCAALLAAACASAPVAPPVVKDAAAEVAAAKEAAEAALSDSLPVTEGDVTSATIAGMQLLVKRVPGAELAAVHLYVRGGARNWSAQDAGIEQLALRVATTGGLTLGGKALGKEEFGKLLAATGVTLASEAHRDASSIAGKGPLTRFDTVLGVVAASFLAPALPAAEVELARQQQLLQLQRREEQPDARLERLALRALFAGHPYENDALGTLESVAKLGPAQVAAHLAKLREGSRLLLVIVGDVEPAQALAAARLAFAAVPRGSYAPAPLARPQFAAAKLATEAMQLPTNYVEASFPGPGPADTEYPAARLAMRLLADRVFEEVRTKRNLSYAPSAGYSGYEAGGVGMLYVSAVDPTTTLGVMQAEVKRLQETPATAAELKSTRAQLRTRFAMAGETTDGLAEQLAQGALAAGDWRWAQRYQNALEGVTAEQVQAFARKYAARFQVVLLGDPAKLDPKVATSL
jgi:predicted Zn-dependent peptidase